MKKSLTVLSLVLLLMALGSSARAVTWQFNFESLDGNNDTWGPESPPVETSAIQYDYQWEITQADIQLSSGGNPTGWIPFMGGLPAEDISGFGTKSSIPFTLSPIVFDEPGINATLFLFVLADGTAGGTLGSIIFSPLSAEVDVTGVRIEGDFTVTPEPATVALLAIGAIAVLRKRRSR